MATAEMHMTGSESPRVAGLSRRVSIRVLSLPWMDFGACALLGILVAFVYAGVRRFAFINFDDFSYVYSNPHVSQGLTWDGIKWAFSTVDYFYWQPLTWISHMLDCQLYGLNAAGHHVTNVGLHALNTMLLYAVFRSIGARMWVGSFLAAIFALHPLRVESVAWVAERKDVLSASFCLLAILAYIGYVKTHSRFQYWMVATLTALGLMCKPSLVVMPLMLMLLDFWPLGRFGDDLAKGQWVRRTLTLVREKIPIFGLAALSSVVTIFGQTHNGAIAPVPFGMRIENALLAYAMYIRKTIWPAKLAIFYPFRPDISGWQVAGGAMVLAGFTWFVLAHGKKRPYLIFGWLWFLIVPLPMIGFIQSGQQAFADRFTHLASIGLAVIVAYGFAHLAKRTHPAVLSLAAVLIVVTLAWRSEVQVQTWRDSTTVYEHALAVTNNNYLAHFNLAHALDEAGKNSEAIDHFTQAIRIEPNLVEAHYSLGKALFARGELGASEASFTEAVNRRPAFADAHYALGLVLLKENRATVAAPHFREALRLGIAPPYATECRRVLNIAQSESDPNRELQANIARRGTK